LHDDPVVTGKNASNVALVPFRQKLNAHLGIIPAFLFGSGYAGLGIVLGLLQTGRYDA